MVSYWTPAILEAVRLEAVLNGREDAFLVILIAQSM